MEIITVILSQQMLDVFENVSDDSVVFQQDSALRISCATQSNSCSAKLLIMADTTAQV